MLPKAFAMSGVLCNRWTWFGPENMRPWWSDLLTVYGYIMTALHDCIMFENTNSGVMLKILEAIIQTPYYDYMKGIKETCYAVCSMHMLVNVIIGSNLSF